MSESHQENSPYLHNSSHLFNQKRLKQAKANQITENLRKIRFYDGIDEAISGQINAKNCESKMLKNNDNNIGKQLKNIEKYIDDLRVIRQQVQICAQAQAKLNQTDVSFEDQQFLLQFLHQHGYISQIKPNLKLAEVFQEMIQKLNRKNNLGYPERFFIEQAQTLQNCRTSRYPIQNLCSIAQQPNVMLNQHQKQNRLYENSKCCVQLNLDNINRNHEEEIPEKKNDKTSKRYLEEDNSNSDEVQQEENEEKEVKEQSQVGQMDRDGLNQFNEHQHFDLRHHGRLRNMQTNKITDKVQFTQTNTIKVKNKGVSGKYSNKQKFKEPLTPRQFNKSTCSNSHKVFKITQISSGKLIGKIGVIKCTIHLSSVQRIIWQQSSLQVEIKEFGLLFVSFSNKKLKQEFMASLISYSGLNQSE